MTSSENLPIIGITGPKGANYQEKLNLIAEKVRLAGGSPQMIPWDSNSSLEKSSAEKERKYLSPQTTAQTIDGWIIGGGADVPPETYGETRRQDRRYTLTARFNFEKELYEILYNQYKKKPILGICYGMQTLNVFANGKLGFVENSNQHDNDQLNTFTVNQGSLLHQIMMNAGDHSRSLLGKCNHGQCLTTLGTDLNISSWHGNIIGSVENNIDGRWIIGTQWHPERTETAEGNNMQIFKEFIHKAKMINH